MINYSRAVLSLLLWMGALTSFGQNSNWQFVGPVSNNNASGHEFETAQMSRIVIDPANPAHMFAGGTVGGMWETNNSGANWVNINTNPNGYNGVLAITFLNSTSILVGNYHVGFNAGVGSRDISTGIGMYNFQTQTWQSLGALPAGSQNYVIKSIAVHPSNPSVLYACTSIGLFRSTDGGVTWTFVLQNVYTENLVFITNATGTSHYVYVAGSSMPGVYGEPGGTSILKEYNDNGGTSGFQFLSDLSSNVTLGSGETRSHSMVILGPQNSASDKEFFVVTTETPGTPEGWDPYGWDMYGGALFLDRFVKNTNTNTMTPTSFTSSGFGGMGGLRLAGAYDPANNRVWFGGQRLDYYDLGTNTCQTYVAQGFHLGIYGAIHDDMHDFEVVNKGGQYYMYAACDGGIGVTSLSSGTIPYFSALNNGLNVCLVNGFSGSEDQPNIYALGGGDIVNTDIYDASINADKHTLATWENDGALIDKFNTNNMIFDLNSYGGAYATSSDGGATMSGGKSYFAPASGNTFAQGSSDGTDAWGFMSQQYFQDPYRAGRIFQSKNQTGIYQYDWVSNTFVAKIKAYAIQPTINWSGSCVPTGNWNLTGWIIINGMSFSPQTPDNLHFIVNGSYDPANPACFTNPSVIEYIGNNLDGTWAGHNDAYNASNPQWANVSPNWATFASSVLNCPGCANVTGSDLNIQFKGIETSPWNKDVVYVGVYMPNNPTVKVLKYDGTNWSNYSDGLPVSEYPFSFVMDHVSNDGLYLSTEMGIYYRDASMSMWEPYSNDLPITFSKQMEINYKENTVRAGVFGRGIWKSPLRCPTSSNLTLNSSIALNFYEANYVTASAHETMTAGPTVMRATNSITLSPGFLAAPTSTSNTYALALIHGCSGGGTSTYQYHHMIPYRPEPKDKDAEMSKSITAFPNPNDGHFVLTIPTNEEGEHATVTVYDFLGKKVEERSAVSGQKLNIDLSEHPKGVYIVQCTIEGNMTTVKVVNQ
ncbi:MAG: T9SS type A sorting domain-containing protein [Bacteroidia bacterium]